MSDSMESRVARIESDVEHIKEVTTDLRVELRHTNDKIDQVRKELTEKIDGVHHGLKDKLHSMAIKALLLYVTLAGGLLTVIARSFKWI